MDFQGTPVSPEGIQLNGPPAVYYFLGIPFTVAGCREEAEEGSDAD